MPQRENAERKTGRGSHDVESGEVNETTEPASRASLTSDIDSILDEIDSVLEENAEDFVKSFIQKGGQ